MGTRTTWPHKHIRAKLCSCSKLLQAAVENEAAEYLEEHRERRTDTGQRTILRNGHHPERELVSGIGPIKVRQPRTRHRPTGETAFWCFPA
jgi:hypothetical protein